MRSSTWGSGGGAEWGRWHDLVDSAVFYVVDEAGNDQLVWCSGLLAESLDVVLHRLGGIGDRHNRNLIDGEAEPVRRLLLDGGVSEARHPAVGVVDHHEFKLHRARSGHACSENTEDGEIS